MWGPCDLPAVLGIPLEHLSQLGMILLCSHSHCYVSSALQYQARHTDDAQCQWGPAPASSLPSPRLSPCYYPPGSSQELVRRQQKPKKTLALSSPMKVPKLHKSKPPAPALILTPGSFTPQNPESHPNQPSSPRVIFLTPHHERTSLTPISEFFNWKSARIHTVIFYRPRQPHYKR